MTVTGRGIRHALAWLRVGAEIAFIIFVIVTTPVAAFFTPRSELERATPLFAGLMVALMVWTVYDLVHVVRTQRAEVSERGAAPTRLDAIWDHADGTFAALSPPPVVGVRALGGPIQGTELLSGLVRRTCAVELGKQRRDVVNALETAMSTCGLAVYPDLYWAPGAGVNAAVAGTPERSAVVLGESMLAALGEEALLGVLVDLLVRLEPGTVRGLHGWDPPGILGNDIRVTPRVAARVYLAADAQAVLALRDTEQLFSALRATASGDPYFPGLTSDQAHLMWTWPSEYAAPVVAQLAALSAESVVRLLELGSRDRERLELARLRCLTEVLMPTAE